VESEISDLEMKAVNLEKATALLTKIGEDRQSAAQEQVETLVTRGLQTIFGEDLSFHLVTAPRGKTAGTEFVVRTTLSDGSTIDTPVLEARGGGLAATVGFLLRLVVILLSESKSSLLVLDETFAMVSDEYLGRLSEFIREIVDSTGVQIVMVTHQPAFTEHGDVVYRFGLKDGKTVVSREG
jgi:DNA repair exonuclease SbcCD ATPase subunit